MLIIIENPFLLTLSLVLRDRICSVRRNVQRDRHGRTHQATKSQLPLLFKLFSQDSDPCPRRPEGHVSPSRSHINNDESHFPLPPSPVFLNVKLLLCFMCLQLFKWQYSQGLEEGRWCQQHLLQRPKPRAHCAGQYSMQTQLNRFCFFLLMNSHSNSSVNKRSHGKTRNSSERHALPQHPHQANANVPQRGSV